MLAQGSGGGAGRAAGRRACCRLSPVLQTWPALSKDLVVLLPARFARIRRAATATRPEHAKRADNSTTRLVLKGGHALNTGGRLQQARLPVRPPSPASAPLHGSVHARRAWRLQVPMLAFATRSAGGATGAGRHRKVLLLLGPRLLAGRAAQLWTPQGRPRRSNCASHALAICGSTAAPLCPAPMRHTQHTMRSTPDHLVARSGKSVREPSARGRAPRRARAERAVGRGRTCRCCGRRWTRCPRCRAAAPPARTRRPACRRPRPRARPPGRPGR